MPPYLYTALLFAAFVYSSKAIVVCNVSSVEVSALHDFYVSTNGQYWFYDPYYSGIPWNFSQPNPNPCYPQKWVGVTCLAVSFGSECLSVITGLSLGDFNLTGTIPNSISNLTVLSTLKLNYNDIGGTIPNTIGEMLLLTKIDLSENHLTGPCPESLQMLNQTLNYLNLGYNMLTSTVPNGLWSEFPVLNELILQHNMLWGEFPSVDLPSLDSFDLDYNYFEGTIDNSICLNSPHLYSFRVSMNGLSGTIPECMEIVEYFDVSYNAMTGSVPNGLDNGFMSVFEVNYNHLTGTIPFLKTDTMQFFFLGNNLFTGPAVLFSSSMFEFYVQSNMLSGTFTVTTVPYSLYFVDVSNNELTGSLPSNLFQNEMESFAASTNCFSGRIPEEICSVESLEYLTMDGLSTAKSCRKPLFPGTAWFSSFTLKYHMDGAIPSCLFEMPNLQLLHLSGNCMAWSFPPDLNVSDSLLDISLSHNKLTGAIPNSLYLANISKLDLSFNKLVGVIDSSIEVSPDSSLILQVNRLSGRIPKSLLHLDSINILSGSLFGCGLNDRDDLPRHDPSFTSYQCGSNAFDVSAVLWCISAGFTVLAVLLAYQLNYLQVIIAKWGQYWKEFYDSPENHNLFLFTRFLFIVRDIILVLTAVILFLFLPIYGSLTHYYGTATYQYAWTISPAFLSGIAPGMTLLLFYMLLICVLFGVWVYLKHFAITSETLTSTQVPKTTWKQMYALMLMVFVNGIGMSLVNGAYVAATLTCSTLVVFFLQFVLSLIKLVWNDIAVKGMIMWSRRLYEPEDTLIDVIASRKFTSVDEEHKKAVQDEIFNLQEMPYMTFIVLFNNIVAPCIATAAVDSNCFYNVFVAPAAVTSTFPVADSDEVFEATLSYDPPFIYSYQCTSAMLTNYATVYVLMYILVGFFKPLVVFFLAAYYDRLPKGSYLWILVNKNMFNLLKPSEEHDLSHGKALFRKDRFVLRYLGKIAVFLTFGVVFPPLAVVLCVAFLAETYLNMFLIGRFLVETKDPVRYAQFRKQLNKDCVGCLDLLMVPLTRLLIPFAAFFYGFFVLDTYGDKVGYKVAIWAPLLLIVTPLVLRALYAVYKLDVANKRSSDVSDDADKIAEMVSVKSTMHITTALQPP